MNVNYKYAGPSMCTQQAGHTVLGLSADLNRAEEVSFSGKLKDPLAFRDAMLMLREIVISDAAPKKKDRAEFFDWLNREIEARLQVKEGYLPGVREGIKQETDAVRGRLAEKDDEIKKLNDVKQSLQKELNRYDAWKDYYALERKFWRFLQERDYNLWYVLDPVITVHPDQVSFEAFSVDESIYGCLSVAMEEFDITGTPKLGTTNIDFSAKLAKEMERFRTYSDVELAVNPEGFAVASGNASEHMEKKIDLPETWIKGFNQVSSAANLSGMSVTLSPADMYDICSFLRKHKAHKSPRYMKWVLVKGEPVRIVFEPFGTELTLHSVYNGEKNREEKIWGRRRWLTAEKLLPIAKSFTVKLLGFGMPQFITADMGNMKMTIGFSSWSANDWVKGTAFNIMSGFIGDGNYTEVRELLKQKRFMTVADICGHFKGTSKAKVIAGIGGLLKRGEGYFDAGAELVRYRQLCNEPIPTDLYETTPTEFAVQSLVSSVENFSVRLSAKDDYVFKNRYDAESTELIIDTDGQISSVKCGCSEFKRGARNISAPCRHILALYVTSAKFTRLQLEREKEYNLNDIMELFL